MDQAILVTGSSSGFGRLIVETLARQGFKVLLARNTLVRTLLDLTEEEDRR